MAMTKEKWIWVVEQINEVRMWHGKEPHPPCEVEEMAEKLSMLKPKSSEES